MRLEKRLFPRRRRDDAQPLDTPTDRHTRAEYATIATEAELSTLADDEWDDLVAATPRPTPFLLHDSVTAWAAPSTPGRQPRRACGPPRPWPCCRASLVETRTRLGLPAAEFVGGRDSLADVVALADADGSVLRGPRRSALAQRLPHRYAVAPEVHLAMMHPAGRSVVRVRSP